MDIEELSAAVEDVSHSYAERFGITRDSAWHLLKLHEEIGELTQAHLMREGQARAKGLAPDQLDAKFRAELAAVFAHVLLLARHHGADPGKEVERKWLVWRESADAVAAAPEVVAKGP
ncbi:MAG TPA: pyrophosphatase [Nocardioides sp.]